MGQGAGLFHVWIQVSLKTLIPRAGDFRTQAFPARLGRLASSVHEPQSTDSTKSSADCATHDSVELVPTRPAGYVNQVAS